MVAELSKLSKQSAATEARRVKESGAGCHRDEKGSLADRRPKESGIGLLNSKPTLVS